MALFQKKKEEYVRIPGLIGEADDYHVYDMTKSDRMTAFLIGMAVGVTVIFVFFRSIVLALIVGAAVGIYAQDFYREHRKKKRLQSLRIQFRDMLESLSSSYASGKNTREAFEDCYNDLKQIYGDNVDIIRELYMIVYGLQSNFNIEQLLRNFAQRSGIEDVEDFADVFEISLRQGANIKNIISSTRSIINDKMEMEMEIVTLMSSGRNELNVMMVMPLVIMLSLGGLGGETSITANTPINVIVKLICLGIFGAAYLLGRKITDFKV